MHPIGVHAPGLVSLHDLDHPLRGGVASEGYPFAQLKGDDLERLGAVRSHRASSRLVRFLRQSILQPVAPRFECTPQMLALAWDVPVVLRTSEHPERSPRRGPSHSSLQAAASRSVLDGKCPESRQPDPVASKGVRKRGAVAEIVVRYEICVCGHDCAEKVAEGHFNRGAGSPGRACTCRGRQAGRHGGLLRRAFDEIRVEVALGENTGAVRRDPPSVRYARA